MKNYEEVNVTQVEGVRAWDANDFVDCYCAQATWKDGTELTEKELDILNEDYHEVVYEALITKFI